DAGGGARHAGGPRAPPAGGAGDGAGNVVIADSGNNGTGAVAAGRGTFYGQAMPAGNIYTIAGDGTPAFAGDGGPAASAELYQPFAVAVDGTGDLVLADYGNNRIRVVPAGAGTFYGQAMAAGRIYTIAGDGTPGLAGDAG